MTPNPNAPEMDAGNEPEVDESVATGKHRDLDHDAGDLVAIRRNILLSGVVGVLAALIGLAFLVRSEWAMDRPLGLLLLLLAATHLVALASWRVPVLVADGQGIRLRLGFSWRGLPWGSIRQVVVERAESPLREGRLVVVPRDLAGTADALDPLGRLHLRWNRLWYDAPLSVPLGMTTFTDTPDLARDLRALSGGRVDIADLRGSQLANLAEVPTRARAVTPPAADDDAVAVLTTTTLAGGMEAVLPATGAVDPDPFDVELMEAPETLSDELPPPPEDDLDDIALPPPVSPLREVRRPVRAEVRLEREADPDDADETTGAATDETVVVPEVPSQRRPGEIAALLAGADLPAADWADAPDPVAEATSPVIGTKIAHAREMLDMSIEELSSRTRIRPHVLEAMEVDDFGPCGGDVYARGHLTSVARILGLSVEPLMATYDERYAQGPINARRVFEAELSTGQSSGMRATFGGPRWSLLISAVLCLTMVWGLARIFAGDTEQLSAAPGAGDVAVQTANRQPITSPLMKTTPMTVTAAHADAHVIVRDRTGRILWSGDLGLGKHRKVVGLAPFKVSADNAGAVTVFVNGKALGTVGTAGAQGAKKFG